MLTYDTTVLERHRAIKGWTRSRLAKAVGIHPTSYLRIVKGQIRNPQTIKAIADVLGVPMDQVVKTEASQSAA